MAYMFLKKEIICSLCAAIYTDPVMLHCGHNFCSDCIKAHISKQGSSGIYRCPECKQMSKTKAPLTVNTKLQSIAQNWKSVENRSRLGEALCTYCLGSPSPAVKVCLHCESSLCEKHLEVHSKSQEHSLVNVTSPPQDRICSVHGEILKFFCPEDKTLICTSCFLTGSHRGHVVELVEVASRHKKEELQEIADHMQKQIDRLKKRSDALQEVVIRNEGMATVLKGEIRTLCCGLLTYVREVATNMETDIKDQEVEVLKEVHDETTSVEKKTERLLQEIKQVEDICNQDDPVLILQDKTCHNLQRKRLKTEHRAGRSFARAEIDLLLVSLKFKKSFENFAKLVPTLLSAQCLHLKYKANILLDCNTASKYLLVSANRKAITYTLITGKRRRPRPGQFKSSHILSETAFYSGRHYWEVKGGKSGVKSVGVAYPSMTRIGPEAFIGYNKKSWGLTWSHGYISVCHNSQCRQIACDGSTMSSVAVYLDYELGQLSFYRICSPVEHLFTFRVRFTEPLYAAFYVVGSWIKINP